MNWLSIVICLLIISGCKDSERMIQNAYLEIMNSETFDSLYARLTPGSIEYLEVMSGLSGNGNVNDAFQRGEHFGYPLTSAQLIYQINPVDSSIAPKQPVELLVFLELLRISPTNVLGESPVKFHKIGDCNHFQAEVQVVRKVGVGKSILSKHKLEKKRGEQWKLDLLSTFVYHEKILGTLYLQSRQSLSSFLAEYSENPPDSVLVRFRQPY